MTKELVAIGDILGFKNTIRSTPLETVVDQYLGFFRRALQHAMNAKGWPGAPEDFSTLREQSSLGIEWFSDTIVIHTKGDTDQGAINLLRVVNWLLFETMFHHATRLRFGIDYHELHASANAGQLVGKAIVGAHELEANQIWAGGALTAAAMERLPAEAATYTVHYDVPVKRPEHPSSWAIDWTQGIHQPFAVPYAPSRAVPNEQDAPDVVAKWRNTITFHDEICATCPTRTT